MSLQKSNYTSEKAVRLEARLSQKQKERIQHAADLTGRTLTDFVLSASFDAANKTIRENEVITLTAQESENFVRALINPPAPNLALQQAAKRHHDFLPKTIKKQGH